MLKRLIRSLFGGSRRRSTTRSTGSGSAESQLAKGAARTVKKRL
ncbi:hypothetical protein [Palleronia rufa]|nr:hypothetical protein [Palleronia rufa]